MGTVITMEILRREESISKNKFRNRCNKENKPDKETLPSINTKASIKCTQILTIITKV